MRRLNRSFWILALAFGMAAGGAWGLTGRGIVSQMYLDLLGRLPTAAEETAALDYMNQGHGPHDPALGVMAGAEYKTPLVQSYYQKFLLRAPSDTELNQAVAQMQAGTIDEQIMANLCGSAEYYAGRAASTLDPFITVVFSDLLNRAPTIQERADWTNYFTVPGTTRTQMAKTLAASNEALKKQLNVYCQRFLRRAADAYDEAQFLDAWHSGLTNDEGVIADLIDSAGYALLPGGSIEGYVVEDTTGDGINLETKKKLSDVTVFVDDNRNGLAETWELKGVTDAAGYFSFTNVDSGVVHVIADPSPGWVVPNSPALVSLSNGSLVTGLYFGTFKRVTITGIAFNDLDKSGSPDYGEDGLENWTVFLDEQQNGQPDAGEPQTVTDAQGGFTFPAIGPGYHALSAVRQLGWHFTTAVPLWLHPTSGFDLKDTNIGVVEENAARDWSLYE